MSARKPGSLVVAPSSKPGNGTLWRDIHSIDGAYSPAYVGEALESDALLFAAAPALLAELKEARRRLATLRVYDCAVFDQQPHGTLSPQGYDAFLAALIAHAEGIQ